MPRTRQVHPEYFKHEGLGALSPLHRLLFQGMWCEADREGRLEDRPKRLKATWLPYDHADGDELVADLVAGGHVLRYNAGKLKLLWIPSFRRWQKVHPNEKPSTFTAHPRESEVLEGGSDDVAEDEEGTPDGAPRVLHEDHQLIAKEVPSKPLPSLPSLPSRSKHIVAANGAATVGADVAGAIGEAEPPPEAIDVQPELPIAQLPPATAEPKPRRRRVGKREDTEPSEWAQLTDSLFVVRATAPKFEAPDDPSFGPDKGQAVAAVEKAVGHLAEEFGLEPELAKERLLQAAWLYCREDWPGNMDRAPPWSLWVLLKHKHLDEYATRAGRLNWRHDDATGRWEPEAQEQPP